MTDLTAITTPFGLLDRETQEALKAHGGPWEYYGADGKWQPYRVEYAPPKHDGMLRSVAIRVKPAPPKPREWWINVRSGDRSVVLHKTREAADSGRRNYRGEIAGSYEEDPIRVREVLSE